MCFEVSYIKWEGWETILLTLLMLTNLKKL